MTLSDKAINIEQLEGQTGTEGCHFKNKDVRDFIKEIIEEIDLECEGWDFLPDIGLENWKNQYTDDILRIIKEKAGEELIK